VIVAGLCVVVAMAALAWTAQRRYHADHLLPKDDPGVSHVHGLGVDPADGTLTQRRRETVAAPPKP
jgi:hypothetical protein